MPSDKLLFPARSRDEVEEIFAIKKEIEVLIDRVTRLPQHRSLSLCKTKLEEGRHRIVDYIYGE